MRMRNAELWGLIQERIYGKKLKKKKMVKASKNFSVLSHSQLIFFPRPKYDFVRCDKTSTCNTTKSMTFVILGRMEHQIA